MPESFDLEKVSSKLSWKEFEGFAKRAFESFGYETKNNHRFTKPRNEIDLLAYKRNTAFAVDCKHWKRTVGLATMSRAAERQTMRSERLLESFEKVIPLILTWHDEMLQILENGVPVIPISKLSDFLLNWDSSERAILVLTRDQSIAYQSSLD